MQYRPKPKKEMWEVVSYKDTLCYVIGFGIKFAYTSQEYVYQLAVVDSYEKDSSEYIRVFSGVRLEEMQTVEQYKEKKLKELEEQETKLKEEMKKLQELKAHIQ